jgi:hypothetical protein
LIDLKKLHAYSDGELSSEERAMLEADLSTCKASQQELLAISQLKSQLRKIEPKSCEATWKSCRDRLNQIDRIEKSGNFITRHSWAAVAVVAALVIVGGGINRKAESTKVSNASLAGVVSGLKKQTGDSQTQANADRVLDTVDRRMNQVQYAFHRNVTLNGIAARESVLLDRLGELRLLSIQGSSNIEGMEPVSGEKYLAGQLTPSLNAISWNARKMTFVLVGDRSHLDLIRLAKANFVSPE